MGAGLDHMNRQPQALSLSSPAFLSLFTALIKPVKCQKLKNHLFITSILWGNMNALPPFTFSKIIQWAGMASLPDRFWAPSLMCDTNVVQAWIHAHNKNLNLKMKNEKRREYSDNQRLAVTC